MRSALLILAALIVALMAWCYAPGLRGAFLFDDAANLPALGTTGPITSTSALERYLTSGHADPTGRPLSVASFLIDAHDWPADPYPFKRTNLILHLINGALLFALLLWLGRLQRWAERKTVIAAFFGAGTWLLHPFFVSTVLYVVQREAMLPATWILAGLLCSLTARARIAEGRVGRGYGWLIFGVGGFTVLALLSKANGILLPLLALVVHSTLPATDDAAADRRIRKALLLVLGPAALLVLGALAWMAVRAIGQPPIPFRGWSVMQRLMTEPSVLADYFGRLLLIRPVDGSLLHDDYPVAKSLFAPWYTPLFAVAWAAIAVYAWRVRRRHASLALALLFFLAGHIMESGPVALELYFEHRNYVPALLLFWPLGAWLGGVTSRLVLTVTAGGLAAVLALLTHAQAMVWGNPLQQAIVWANGHPSSGRAQAYAALSEADAGRLDLAIHRLEGVRSQLADDPQIGLNLVSLYCHAGTVPPTVLEAAQTSLRTASREPGPLLLQWFDSVLPSARQGQCAGLGRPELTSILDAALANPRIANTAGRRQDVQHERAAIALAWGDADDALQGYDAALAVLPSPQTALEQAASLGRAGHPALGLRHLAFYRGLPAPRGRSWRDGMPWLHDKVLERQGYWENEVRHLEGVLQADAARRAAHPAYAR